MSAFDLVSALLAAPVLMWTAYLVLLTLLSGRQRLKAATHIYRFVAVVPAHNEAGQIGTTVKSLQSVRYPAEALRVVVVADNCTDTTAGEAREAGARVLERFDPERRGKGYALDYAFNILLGEGWMEAVVVVDADSLVAPELFTAFAGQLEAGARAVQGDYTVRNPESSWRTRLMMVALSTFHRLRSLARERLGVSVGLRGNGMCFLAETLQRVPHRAAGLVEDVEYGLALGHAGVRVAYADTARVMGEMVSSAKASESQRQRWEGGRLQLARRQLPDLVRSAWRQRSLMLADLACDLAVPPLSYVGLSIGLGLAFEAARMALWGAPGLSLGLWLTATVGLIAYVLRGAALSEMGARAYLSLAWAPFYVAWKLITMLRPRRRSQAWVRTKREQEPL